MGKRRFATRRGCCRLVSGSEGGRLGWKAMRGEVAQVPLVRAEPGLHACREVLGVGVLLISTSSTSGGADAVGRAARGDAARVLLVRGLVCTLRLRWCECLSSQHDGWQRTAMS